MSTPLPLIVGEIYTRQDLAVEYGGSRQGGIIASSKSDSVLIFTDPAEGNQFGYVYDGFSGTSDIRWGLGVSPSWRAPARPK